MLRIWGCSTCLIQAYGFNSFEFLLKVAVNKIR